MLTRCYRTGVTYSADVRLFQDGNDDGTGDFQWSVRPGFSGAVVRIEGEIDFCAADRLQELLLRVTRAHGPWLLLDLSAVTFIDCAGLRALVLARRRAELCGWSIHLIAASAMVRKIITLTGAKDALPVWNLASAHSGLKEVPR
jgi:anti-sigma B factor antagonist